MQYEAALPNILFPIDTIYNLGFASVEMSDFPSALATYIDTFQAPWM